MAYQKNNASNNNSNNNNQAAAPVKKHSGCKLYKWVPKEGPNKGIQMFGVLGWKFRKGLGLTKYKANLTSKSKLSENGWFGSVAIELISATGMKSLYWGTMQQGTGKVVINDLGEVMNPKGGKGGYVGSFSNS